MAFSGKFSSAFLATFPFSLGSAGVNREGLAFSNRDPIYAAKHAFFGAHTEAQHFVQPAHRLTKPGYNFQSLQHITPFLEPTAAGITSLWARTTALKYNCVVTAGYPEKVDVSPKWPAGPEYYNSAITVNQDGETVANYRKSFLYYTDETWALEGPSGFYAGEIDGLGKVAMGICEY